MSGGEYEEHLRGELAAADRRIGRLEAELAAERGDADKACRMLAKCAHRGPWTLTPAEWVTLGRKMAGLKPREDGPS